ncbi:Ba10 [Baboon cytomegalovirus]|nr:Ba10 [Baboon cytomegalovirus]
MRLLAALAWTLAFTTHQVVLGHIYGETLEKQHQLRLFKDGKMKYQIIDGEVYPPTVKEAQVHMVYEPSVPEKLRFALGNEMFGLVPGLMVYAIIWLREHNRVCDVLKQEHPEWNDEQLFQITRLIINISSRGKRIPPALKDTSREASKQAPKKRYRSLNEYRKRFGFKSHKLLNELTGKEIAVELEAFYGDIEAVELYAGFLAEKPCPDAILDEGVLQPGAPFSLRGLAANVICSPASWKRNTFGSSAGFNIARSATIQSLICSNIKGCPLAAFRAPNRELMRALNGSSLHSKPKAAPVVEIKKHTEL